MSSPSETESVDSPIGSILADRYRLDELVGEGGMGKVYAAEHVLMRKRVAVKVLHREISEVPELVARFEREAMATANIAHPNIASATDCGKLPDGSLFLVLELVRGKSLRDEISQGAMPVPRALHIAQQIAAALAAAHALDIVHRDLKPENVMLVTDGDDPDFVKLFDFGVAKVPAAPARAPAGAPLTKLGVVFGTPEYMPPEQALGQNVDHRADLYALGVIAYELLCGARPFSAKSDAGILGQQLSKTAPAISERVPGIVIPKRVEEVVLKLLAREANARYQSAEEVARAFEELQQAPPEPAVESVPRTALLGTAEQVFGVESAAVPPPQSVPDLVAPEPVAAPGQVGPAGTLLLDDGRKQELAERVAEVQAAQSVPRPVQRPPGFLSRELDSVLDYVDSLRERLPEGPRRALRDVPAGGLLALVAAMVVGAIAVAWIGLAVSTRPARPAASASAPAPSSSAGDPILAELTRAKQEGPAALEKLAEAHPDSAVVLYELALSQATRSNLTDAVATLGRSLAIDPKMSAAAPASELLAAAVRKRESTDAAFELLEGPMGAAGAAVVYDLSVDQKVTATTRRRAQEWVVQSPEFLKHAAPNVEVAAKLRYAKSCAARHALLPRVAEVGDRRALAYLKIMKNRSGCGRRNRDDCFPCLRKDDELEKAVAAVEKRASE
jgi:serine/threonine protein kinase